MEIKVYSIQLDIPARAKRVFIRFGIPALLFIGMIGVVRADAVTIPNTFSNGDTLSASQMNANFVALADAVEKVVPVGAILAYYGDAAPAGWLIANGTTIDKSANVKHSELVDHLRTLNTAQGQSNIVDPNQAVLPDLRGRFLRGQDRGAALNPDCGEDLIGGGQGWATALPSTPFYTNTNTHNHSIGYSENGLFGGYHELGEISSSAGYKATTSDSHNHVVESGGDSETRPVNVTVLYIIKY